MRIIETLTIFALLTLLLASSCTQKETPAPTSLTSKEASPAKAETAKEAWENKWDEVLKEAKKEGRVMVSMGIGGLVRDALVKGFKQKFGIEVETFSGRGDEFTARLFAERRAGLYNYDVYQSGPNTVLLTLKPGGALDPLEPALVLPEVLDPKVWWKGDILWLDKEHLALNFLAYPSIPVAINTSMVRPEEISSYNDLLDARWKEKIIMNDPTISGPGGHLVGAIGDRIMGYDFLRNLAQQKPFITRDRSLPMLWLATGKYPVAINPDAAGFMQFQQAGAPVVRITPKEGTHVTPGFGSLALINKAPHPNAAKLYINWLLSREGQEIYTRVAGVHSGRLDVSTDFLPPAMVRNPAMKYVDISTEEYNLKMPEYIKIAREIFGDLVK